MTGEEYEDLIRIVETAHGVTLTPAEIDLLSERLDDEEKFFPPMSLAEALEAVRTGAGPRIGVREHARAIVDQRGDRA